MNFSVTRGTDGFCSWTRFLMLFISRFKSNYAIKYTVITLPLLANLFHLVTFGRHNNVAMLRVAFNSFCTEKAAISNKLKPIYGQLFTKCNLAKETDTVKVHVWRDSEEHLVTQKRITGIEFRGSEESTSSKTTIALFQNGKLIEDTSMNLYMPARWP